MKVDRLFEMFWDVKDEIEENADGTMSMSVVINPKYGSLLILSMANSLFMFGTF